MILQGWKKGTPADGSDILRGCVGMVMSHVGGVHASSRARREAFENVGMCLSIVCPRQGRASSADYTRRGLSSEQRALGGLD